MELQDAGREACGSFVSGAAVKKEMRAAAELLLVIFGIVVALAVPYFVLGAM